MTDPGRPRPFPKRFDRYLYPAIIILVGFLAYSNSFGVPFHFDDISKIVTNPGVKGFDYDSYRLRLIGYATFSINYKLHGMDVWGYHAVNLAIHLTAALLVFFLTRLTFRTPLMKGSSIAGYSSRIALIAALLFVSHPVQTQAVTYIVQRFASLSTMFYLLSILLYAKCRLSAGSVAKSVVYYLLAIVSTALAMKTKSTAFTIPAAMIAYEFVFFGEPLKRRLVYILPLVLTVPIVPVSFFSMNVPLTSMLEKLSDITRLQTDMSRWDYLLTEFGVLTTYIRLIFLPVNQNLDYDYPLSTSFFEARTLLSFIFLLAVFLSGVYLLVRSRKGDPAGRLVFFGILWFFLTLSVESSIIPIVDVIYEHRVYLATPGAFAAIAAGAFMLAVRLKGPKGAAYLTIFFGAAVLALGISTYSRNLVWQDELRFWQDVASKSPGKPRAHNNLARAYENKGMTGQAIAEYEEAIRLKPDHVLAHKNLSRLYASAGMRDKAEEHFRSVLSITPGYSDAYLEMGNAYLNEGSLDKAIEYYSLAVEMRPENAGAYYNLGLAYYLRGWQGLAEGALEDSLSRDPTSPQAHKLLGDVMRSMGKNDRAVAEYKEALLYDPDYADAHYGIALIYGPAGRLNEAAEHLEAALASKPDLSGAHQNLGNIYLLKQRTREAIGQYIEALKLDPDNAMIHYNLSIAYRNAGNPVRADEHLIKARTLDPEVGKKN